MKLSHYVPAFAMALTALATTAHAQALGQPGLQGPLAQECKLLFEEDSISITMLAGDLGYGSSAVGEEAIRIVEAANDGAGRNCKAQVRVSRLTSDESFPQYRLSAGSRVLQPSVNEASGGSGNQIVVRMPASRSASSVNLRTIAATEWGIPAGRHVEQLQLSLIDEQGTIVDRMTLSLILDIPKTVDVMFVGATGNGRTTSIDLGFLSQTEETRSSPFGVRVWSTSGYAFGFSSQHNGQLRHEQGRDLIPYKMDVDGDPINLGSKMPAQTRMTPSARRGDFYRLMIAVPGRRSIAGRYSDRITVTVSAL